MDNQTGDPITYPSGAKRDSKADKPAMELIHWPFVEALAKHLGDKAPYYGRRNWEKGLPKDTIIGSLLRHASALASGDESEDHAVSVAFNAMAYWHHHKRGLFAAAPETCPSTVKMVRMVEGMAT